VRRKYRLHPKRLIKTLHKILKGVKDNKVKNSYSKPAKKELYLPPKTRPQVKVD